MVERRSVAGAYGCHTLHIPSVHHCRATKALLLPIVCVCAHCMGGGPSAGPMYQKALLPRRFAVTHVVWIFLSSGVLSVAQLLFLPCYQQHKAGTGKAALW